MHPYPPIPTPAEQGARHRNDHMNAAAQNPLQTWRLQALNWILRGQFIFWTLSYAVGIWNSTLTYWEKSQTDPNTLELFIVATALYSVVFTLLTFITFFKKLGYRPRLYAFLGIYYFLSSGLFSLSALSGDARLFLYAFVILAAIFLDMPWNQLALAAALLNFAVMGWLNVTGIITIAAEHQYNASSPSSWVTGGIVFAALSISLSLGITLLLRSFADSLEQANLSLQNAQRASDSLRLLSNVNQLVVREHDPQRLLEKTCQFIVENGYPHASVSLLQPDGVSLSRTACAGISDAPIPECALQAVRTRAPISAPPCLAIPVLRPDRAFGVLIASAETPFAASEMTLFQELADDLAYALENIETENQRRAIAETAAPLLTARDETEFWSAALQAVQAALRTDRAAIYVYEYGIDRLTCPYATGLSQEYIDEINRRFREVPGARLFRDPQPVPVNDTESNPLAAPLRPLFLREGIRSYCVFPLFSAQKLLGAFVSYRNAVIPFSKSDLEAGQTLAHLVAASLQNVRLFAETRAKANEQAALFIAAQEISASLLNPPALLETFAKQLTATLDATSVYIISLDPTGETLKVLSEYWAESASPAERKPDLGRIYQTKDFPHVIHSMKSGKALNLQFDESNLTSAERNEYTEYGTHAKLFVPLMWQGQTVGYTEIWESRGKREFTQHEIHLAQALCAHAASVIHATNLFSELEKRETHFRTLIENAVDGIAILNKDATFRYLSPSVERILGYHAEELAGSNAFDNIHPDDQGRIMAAFAEGISKPDVVMRVEYRFRHRNGRWLYLEAVAHSLLHDPALSGVVVNYRDVTERKQAEENLIQAYDSTLEGWARALELRDKDTEGHTRRVTELAVSLARAMNIPEEQLIHIQRGATLHDIGKVAVPDRILHKPASLTTDEMETMRQHPRYAYEMLSSIEYLRSALDIPHHHHERWDGSGYPSRLKGEDIPLSARIFSVVDVWDALTSNRPYRPAWEKQQTIDYILENSGVAFDPQVVKAFLSIII